MYALLMFLSVVGAATGLTLCIVSTIKMLGGNLNPRYLLLLFLGLVLVVSCVYMLFTTDAPHSITCYDTVYEPVLVNVLDTAYTFVYKGTTYTIGLEHCHSLLPYSK